METVSFSKTLVPLYQSTRHVFTEDWEIHQYCSENLKSYWPDGGAWLNQLELLQWLQS